jgi:chromosome segregation ATPase
MANRMLPSPRPGTASPNDAAKPSIALPPMSFGGKAPCVLRKEDEPFNQLAVMVCKIGSFQKAEQDDLRRMIESMGKGIYSVAMSMKGKGAAATQQLDTLIAENESLLERSLEKDGTIKKLTSELDDVRKKFEHSEQHTHSMVISQQEAEARHEKLRKELIDKDDSIKKLTAALMVSQQQIEAQKTAAEDNARELTAELAALRERMILMEKKNSSLFMSLEESKQINTEKEELFLVQAEVYHRNIAAKDQEASELQTKLSCCKAELTRCQSDLAQATSETKLTHTAKNELTAELDALRERMILMEENNSSLFMSLEESKQINLMKEKHIMALMDENKDLKSAVDARQKEIEMVLATSQQHDRENETCIKELTRKRNELTVELDTSHGNAKGLTAELKELRQKLDCMVKECDLVRQELNCMVTKEKRSKELENSRVKESKAQLEALRQTVAVVEEHNCVYLRSLAESKLDNEKKEKRITELTIELDKEQTIARNVTRAMWQQKVLVEEARASEGEMQLQELETLRKNDFEKDDCREKLTTDLVASRQRIKTLTDEIAERNAVIEAKVQQLDTLVAENESLLKDILEKDGTIKKLTSELDDVRKKLVIFEQNTHSIVISQQEAETRREESKKVLEGKTTDLKNAQAHLKEMAESITKMEGVIVGKESAITTLENKLADSESMNKNNYTVSHQKELDVSNKAPVVLFDTSNSLKQTFDASRKQIDTLSKEKESLLKDILEKDGTIKKLTSELDAAARKVDALSKENEDLIVAREEADSSFLGLYFMAKESFRFKCNIGVEQTSNEQRLDLSNLGSKGFGASLQTSLDTQGEPTMSEEFKSIMQGELEEMKRKLEVCLKEREDALKSHADFDVQLSSGPVQEAKKKILLRNQREQSDTPYEEWFRLKRTSASNANRRQSYPMPIQLAIQATTPLAYHMENNQRLGIPYGNHPLGRPFQGHILARHPLHAQPPPGTRDAVAGLGPRAFQGIF